MSDKRANNGGKREGAGRPKKLDEIALIEKLTPMAEKAFKALEEGLDNKDFRFVKLFMEYYAGKPTEKKEISLDNDLAQVIVNLGNGEK